MPDFVPASNTVTFAIAAPGTGTSRAIVTGLGQGSVAVTPRDPRDNRSIRDAVEAARRAAIPKAIAEAKESAAAQAQAAGLALGAVVSIGENRAVSYGIEFAPFGPGRYCGVVRQPIFERVSGSRRRKIVGFKKSRRCVVPRSANASFYVKLTAS
ncbi:MAG: SIMPL domain-containing protein [Thermoleophilaceae bacterium]